MLKHSKKSKPVVRKAFDKFQKTTILSPEQQKQLKGGNGEEDTLPPINGFVGDTDIIGG